MSDPVPFANSSFFQGFAVPPTRAYDLNAAIEAAKAAALAAASGTVISEASGDFYQDQGAHVMRQGDRLLVGAAADNPANANRDQTPRDWLSDVMAASPIGPYATWGAQTASIARCGNIGILGASRSSDSKASTGLLGYEPASIGIASWAINDDTTTPTTTTAWAYYGEAWRQPGVNYQPTFGMELEVINRGGVNYALPNPYRVNVGGGTVGIQIGSGGGQGTGTDDASSVLTTVANPSKFQSGIIFGSDAHTGVNENGDGYAEVISMARGHGLGWHTPEVSGTVKGSNVGFMVRSTVSAGSNGSRLEAQDSGLVATNSNGQAVFAVGQNPDNPQSFLSTFAGSGTNPAGINVFGASHDLYVATNGTGNIRVNGHAVYHEGNPPPTSGGGSGAASGGTADGSPAYPNSNPLGFRTAAQVAAAVVGSYNLVNPVSHEVNYPNQGDGSDMGAAGKVNGGRSLAMTATPANSPLGSGTNVADTIILQTTAGSPNGGGNQVAQGVQLFMHPGSGDGWALNPLTVLTAGTEAMATVAEFDLGNWSGDGGPWGANPAFPWRSHGIWITGSAPYKCTTAAYITSAGHPQWYQGIWFDGNSVSDNTIVDKTNSTVSYAIHGVHAIGLDTVNGTFSESAVRLNSGHKITWTTHNVGNPVSLSATSSGGLLFDATPTPAAARFTKAGTTQFQEITSLSSGSADQKLWDVLSYNGGVSFRWLKDDQSASTSFLTLNRAGITSTAATLKATAITLDGDVNVTGTLTSTKAVRLVSGTADTPTSADLNGLVVCSNSSPITITVNDLGGYGSYGILQSGGGAVTVVGANGVTLISDKATPSFTTARRGAALTVVCAGGGNVFILGNTA